MSKKYHTFAAKFKCTCRPRPCILHYKKGKVELHPQSVWFAFFYIFTQSFVSSVVAFFPLIPSETTLFYFIPAQTHTSPQRCVGLLYLCIVFQNSAQF